MTTDNDVQFAALTVIAAQPNQRRRRINNWTRPFAPLAIGLFGGQFVFSAIGLYSFCPWWISLPILILGIAAFTALIRSARRYNQAAQFYFETVSCWLVERGMNPNE